MGDKIRVLLVENDLDFVFLIRKMITGDPNLEFLENAQTAESGIELAVELRPDVVLMDLNLTHNKLDGIGAAREIRTSTSARVLLLTSYEQPETIISASKKAFASGYIFKSQCQTLTDQIRKTVCPVTPQGQLIRELVLRDLTPAERSVLDMIVSGNVTLQSATKTLANQKTSIFKKLGLKNTHELIRIFSNW